VARGHVRPAGRAACLARARGPAGQRAATRAEVGGRVRAGVALAGAIQGRRACVGITPAAGTAPVGGAGA
jgi:hypothetical protein